MLLLPLLETGGRDKALVESVPARAGRCARWDGRHGRGERGG